MDLKNNPRVLGISKYNTKPRSHKEKTKNIKYIKF